jgi:8-oxo-dGTP pyrophosphatase MutT (NUDIX family)
VSRTPVFHTGEQVLSLSAEDVERFVRDGFVKLAGAFTAETAEACRRELWQATGCDPDDRSTWTKPVVRLDGFGTAPFRTAANTQVLHEAFDEIVGAGNWEPRNSLGTVPVRFPSTEDPGDAGWHVEASYTGQGGEYRLNLRSRGRALLMLFLFSEVGPEDAPTRIRVGSHLDVPKLLVAAGDAGREWFELCVDAVEESKDRPVALATGGPGDVYLCHPFLVHAAQPHRGRVPRFMAQPPLYPTGLLELAAQRPTPVERAVMDALRS